MLFLQPCLFCLKLLEPFVEPGNLFVLVREFFLCSGKVSLAEPREDGVPALLRLLHICLQLGYRYQEAGKPSAQILTVVVRGLNRPAHVLLEDIAWQVQPQAVVRVDPIGRSITLARTVNTGGLS